MYKNVVIMPKPNKKSVKLNTYKKKFHWQALVKAFKQGFDEKPVDNKYCNDNRISAGIIIIAIIACLLIWLS